MPKVINTVGELKELLRHSEDDEPLVLTLDDEIGREDIKCDGASSSGGGRITILWFKRKNVIQKSNYQI